MAFDEWRLDDPAVLAAAELRLRGLAESGARVRREGLVREETHVEEDWRELRPRSVVVAGAGAEMLAALLTPTVHAPVVCWSTGPIPGWVGALDLVLVLAPDGGDSAVAQIAAEASRRGSRLIAATPHDSLVASHATGSGALVLATTTTDEYAVGVALAALLADLGVGVSEEPDAVAAALDETAVECSPFREFTLNPAKLSAIALADTLPLVWAGSAGGRRAAAQIASALMAARGGPAVAGGVAELNPLIEAARTVSIFDDPFDGSTEARPAILLLDEGPAEGAMLAERHALTAAADQRNLRVELLTVEQPGPWARYGVQVLRGRYVAEYLRLGSAAPGSLTES